MARRLMAVLALTFGLVLLNEGAVGFAPIVPQAYADGGASAVDSTLQATANAIVPLLERVTARHPHLRPSGNWNDPLLARLKKVLKTYRAQHPSTGIQLAVSLFSASSHKDLTSRTNEKWDFLASPWFFDGPVFQTESNYYNGANTGSYRVYATPFAIPGAYQQQGFKPSLAVFVALPATSQTSP